MSSAQAAIYAAASRFITTGTLALQAMRLAAAPEISAAMAADDKKRASDLYRVTTQLVILASWPLYLMLAVFAPGILLLFGGGKISGLMGDLAKGIKSFKANIKEDENDASMEAQAPATPPAERNWLGDEQEWLLQYCQRKIELGVAPDYFVFGHRHLPIDWRLKNERSRYLNLGDWMWHNSYGVFDGQEMEIRFFENEGKPVTNWLS